MVTLFLLLLAPFIASYFPLAASKYARILEFKSYAYNPSMTTISYEVVNRTYLNYNLTLLKVYNTDVLCSMNIKKVQRNKITPLLKGKKLNYCRFLEIYKTDRIFRAMFEHVVQPTFVSSCPFREGLYYMKNAYFDLGLLEKIFPRGTYRIQVEVYVVEDGIQRVINNFLMVAI